MDVEVDVPGLTEAGAADDTELALNAKVGVPQVEEDEVGQEREDEQEDRSYARAVRIIETECVDAQRTQPGLSVERWLKMSGLDVRVSSESAGSSSVSGEPDTSVYILCSSLCF